MPHIRFRLIALSTLLGCGYSEDRFDEDYAAAMCASLTDCEQTIIDTYTSLGTDAASAQSMYESTHATTCETTEDSGGRNDPECAFDSRTARACIRAIEDADCGIWTGDQSFPTVCAEVCGAPE